MNIGTRQHLATTTVLVAIGLIAAAIVWAQAEVSDANRERRQTTQIVKAYSELRLVTIEYLFNRHERARAQWYAVSDRIDRLIAENGYSGLEQKQILAGLREKRAVAPRNFAAFAPVAAEDRANAAEEALRRHFEAQPLSRLLISQQDSIGDAFRLTELAAERIDAAQRRVAILVLAGLALIALITAGGSWLIHRSVVTPIVRLQRATREVAAGNRSFRLGIGGNDEIGDLTKNFDAMANSLQEQFVQLERGNQDLAALNQELEAFSYSVSHDLRGPLRSMDGFSLALLEDYGDKLDEDGKDALERVRAASQRMGALIDDLLRLSQVTRAGLNVTRVDLSAIAHEIADALHRDEAGRSVEWAIETGLSVRADPALTRIAMQNLLQNAWKFTGRTDRPVIRVGALERDGQRLHFVADNGAGFDMTYADRLFGAFQRLHHTGDFPGTGIGLAIVQRIIRRHDGEIRAEAKPGVGATFFFSMKESENGSDEQDHPAG